MAEQVERLARWLKQGWNREWYDYNILAMLIGYGRAKSKRTGEDL